MSRMDPSIEPGEMVCEPAADTGSGPTTDRSARSATLDERAAEAQAAYRAARREAEQAQALEHRMHYGTRALCDPTFGRALRSKRQLPGESATSFAVHHAAIMADFEPRTSLEITLLESFIRLDWEIVRLRALREQAIEDAVRARIAEILRTVRLRKSAAAPGAAAGSYLDSMAAAQVDLAAEVETVLDTLLDWRDGSDGPEDPIASAAQLALEELGITPLRILGEVLHAPSALIVSHDAQIAALEPRRSAALKDLAAARRIIRA